MKEHKVINRSTKAALHTVAEDFRKGNQVDDLKLILERVGTAIEILNPIGWGPNEDDEEFLGYLKEVEELLMVILKRKDVKKKVIAFINNLSWDNFIDDDTKAAYTLGSMYYNKMNWIYEGCTRYSEVQDIAHTLSIHIKELFDELENYANS